LTFFIVIPLSTLERFASLSISMMRSHLNEAP
jgi:hypothetical protein